MERTRGLRVVVLSGLFLTLATARVGLAQVADPNPARLAAEIRAFELQDQKNSFPKGAVLFVGSSSIRLWPTADRFAGLTVINRGFGGSHISDVNHYIGQTVLKYGASVVLLYAGDNDIGTGKSPEQVLGDYQAFVTQVHAAKPDTEILFIAVKPSLARWTLWPTARAFNDLVRDYSASRPRLHFVDVAPPMIGADGRPRRELFVDDGLHMTAAGYDIWTAVVSRALEPLIRR